MKIDKYSVLTHVVWTIEHHTYTHVCASFYTHVHIYVHDVHRIYDSRYTISTIIKFMVYTITHRKYKNFYFLYNLNNKRYIICTIIPQKRFTQIQLIQVAKMQFILFMLMNKSFVVNFFKLYQGFQLFCKNPHIFCYCILATRC